MSYSYIYCGSEDKYDWDTLFKECFPIDNIARKYMILAINELRSRVSNTETMVPHHIIPRCFYDYKNLVCDSSPNNLIYVTQEEHLFFHSCAASCCNYNIKSKLKQPVVSMLGYWKDAQKEGIKKAMANGVHFGRPTIPKPPEDVWKPVIERVNRGEISARQACRELNFKNSTFYRLFGNDIDKNRTTKATRMSQLLCHEVPLTQENIPSEDIDAKLQ